MNYEVAVFGYATVLVEDADSPEEAEGLASEAIDMGSLLMDSVGVQRILSDEEFGEAAESTDMVLYAEN